MKEISCDMDWSNSESQDKVEEVSLYAWQEHVVLTHGCMYISQYTHRATLQKGGRGGALAPCPLPCGNVLKQALYYNFENPLRPLAVTNPLTLSNCYCLYIVLRHTSILNMINTVCKVRSHSNHQLY